MINFNKNKNLFISVGVAIIILVAIFYFRGNMPINNSGNNNSTDLSFYDLVGKPAPNFVLEDYDGNIYSLDNLRGKNTILFFNEGLMCYPGCWNQIAAFGEDVRFKDNNTVALSVVVDSKKDWQYAINKMPTLSKAIVVFDKNAEISRKFGTLTLPSVMHHGALPGHSYVLIDKQGIVRYVLDDPMMGIQNDRLIAEINKIK